MDEKPSDILLQAYAQAPVQIQAFLRSGKFEQFMRTIQPTLGVHLDAANKVSNEVLMMLLGMSEPGELPQNLAREAGLTEEQIGQVIEAANREIFMPLQAAMQKPPEVATPQKPPVIRPAVSPTMVPAPESQLEAPEPVTSLPAPESAPIQTSKPIPPMASAPVPPTNNPIVENKFAPNVPMPQPAEPFHARTMATDVDALKTGRVPQPFVREVPPPIMQQPPAVSAAPLEKTETPTAQEIENTLKKYGVDPYREPVE